MDKKYNHEQSEKESQIKWQEENTYSLKNNPGQIYTVDTPPPTVSGTLHIGHIFSYTQTDIIARYKRMRGFSVFYPFGFDDNGLPTERFVEKKRKISSFQMPSEEFIKICLEETKLAAQQFKILWQKIGLSVNWESNYSTISDEVRKLSQESFILLYKKGYIYRKKDIALYCTTCYTSVSQAELDDKEIDSFFNDIEFKTTDGKKLVIGTTRPELLPSCVALLYHPNDKRYQNLKNSKVIVPIYNYEVPILQDESVDPEKGTGLVMCCTFGDKKDIQWYKKFNLPYRQSIGLNGKWTEITGPLAGLKVHEARTKILEILKENGLLFSQKPIKHFVNVHERCKKEIEYIEIPQWFIKILEYKNEFLKMGNEIKWYPDFMKSRYDNWVENLSWDWCISRQRNFGIKFPVWHCLDCQEIILADIKELPIDPQSDFAKNKKSCDKCKSSKIVPDTDVMDTWNTSSLTPQICYMLFKKTQEISNSNEIFNHEIKKFIPMSMRPQAHDIIRTWAFDTIVKSWMHHNEIPWKNIVISGHVLSGKEKISKSKENESTTPENLLARYPADAIRFWTASGNLGHDISFSESQLLIGQKLITKLWNAFRFSYEHLQNFVPNKEPKKLFAANEWILHQASESFKSYEKYFEQYEFGLALDAVEKFFWKDYCDNYLELIKDQLFKPEKYTIEEVEATKWTLYHVGLRILQFYAPYLPYVTESIFAVIYKNNLKIASIHQTKYSQVQKIYNFEQSKNIMEDIIKLISEIRKLKTENQLSLKTEIEELQIFCSETNSSNFENHEQLIKGITQAKKIVYLENEIDKSEIAKINDLWFAKIKI